jgi:4-aminobutyrate aminotransferase-like enzyme/Ser/Thr protein kinase RdoA (MazF antagonist)/murein DD-endopeptidase MepM/ murein hydrolase activator NlpD
MDEKEPRPPHPSSMDQALRPQPDLASVDDPLRLRPTLSAAHALAMAERHFPLAFSLAEPLPSDRDQNFLLTAKESGRRYVLKLAHAGEDPGIIDFQNRILEHLGRAGFPISKVLFSMDGREVVEARGEGDVTYLTRLLTWLPGEVLAGVNPQLPPLLRSLGAFLGSMDRALEDFSHPAQDRELKWDLKHGERVVRGHLAHVEDPVRRQLLEAMAEGFSELLRPLLPGLRTSVIHGDANDHNVLVGEGAAWMDPWDRRVTGLVDFGDAVRSYTVGEAAIAAAYAMLGRDDPLTTASHVVAGYHRALPLREEEMAALYPLMGLRLCTSAAISAHQKKLEPDNRYLTISEAPAWALLERLRGESPDLPHFLFRQACGVEPVPGSRAVVKWLGIHGGEAAPVVGRSGTGDVAAPLDLSTAPVHVFDLGADSGEFGLAPEPEDAEGWARTLFQRMETVGAVVGVGRYDEVRRWYTSDIFQAPGEGTPEWRTVHMGVDLFLPAGSPVFAPFDATVHSVALNAGPLDYGPTVILQHRMDGEARFWTLYGHLAGDVLDGLGPGQHLAKGERFASIGNYPINGNWAPHLHLQVITHTLGRRGDYPGVAAPSRRDLWRALSPDPNLILRIPDPWSTGAPQSLPTPGAEAATLPGRIPRRPPASASPGHPSGASLAAAPGRSVPDILRSRRDHLGPNLSVAYARPLKIVRGRGQFLYDHQGQPYLDAVNNVPHVGHCHPRVVEAGQQAMAVLNTNTRYLHDSLVEYAERLLATLPEPLSVVYFVCSGSEANELALRMARAHTGRRDVVVVEGGYHGNTSAMVDLSPYKFDGPGGEGPRPWVHKTLMPDPYRGRFRAPLTDDLGPLYALQLRELLRRLEEEAHEPAAFFCEPLLGCGGQIVPPQGYLADAFRFVREAGGVCVADEVQVGFGRVGTHFWAFEAQGVVPDIVTLGKPMGNGHPMGALVTTPEIAASFRTGMEYFNTFGGNPVSCAMGMAVLDVLREEGLQENARAVGRHLLEGLRGLMGRHALIGDVRGLGLYLGVELVEDPETRIPATAAANRVKERLRDFRVLLSTDGPDDNVLKIKPPMVFTRQDADRVISCLDRILREDWVRM